MGATENLRQAADAVTARAKEAGCAAFETPVRRLHQAAQRVGLAWCGSWLPGMANLYGQALQPAAGGLPRPPELAGSGRVGWVEWAPDDIRRSIHQAAGLPDVQQLLSHAAKAAQWFDDAKANALAALAIAQAEFDGDPVLQALHRDTQQLRLADHDSLLQSWRPTSRAKPGQPADSSRDWDVPAHLSEMAAIEAIRGPSAALQALAALMRRAVEHGKALQLAAYAQSSQGAARARAFAPVATPLHQLVADNAGRPRGVVGAHAR